MAKAINYYFHNEDIMRRVTLSLVASVIALSGLYGVIVQQSIVKLVDRSNAERAIKAEKSALAELESTYLALRSAITEDVALLAGFVKSTSQLYAVESDSTLSLSNAR